MKSKLYEFVICWNEVAKIEYQDSIRFFKAINGTGLMEHESQFAYWIYKKFGEGEYSVIGWRRGKRGFFSFIKLMVTSDGYRRTKRTKSKEESEVVGEKKEIEGMKKQLINADNSQEAEELQEEIEAMEDLVSSGEDYIDSIKSRYRGPSPYLKVSIPPYRFHSYDTQSMEKDEKQNYASGRMF